MFSALGFAAKPIEMALFIPHGHCYLWKTNLVGLHLLSDAAIALAYYSIPAMLVYFVRKRSHLPFAYIFILFGAFILSCGTTHIMEIWTLWHPNYWASGVLKAFTAAISVVTAAAVIPILPKALELPSPQELESANQKLNECERIGHDLIASNSQFMGAFIAAAIGMALVSLEGQWLQVNQSICELLGYSAEELMATTFQDITHPDDLETDLNYVQQILRGEIESFTMEKRYFHKQGYILWVLLAVSIVRDSNGHPLFFVSQIEDITQRKLAETILTQRQEELEDQVQARTAALEALNAALRDSQAKYSDLYENAPEMYVSVDPKTAHVIECNQTLLNTLGYQRDTVVGQPVFNLYDPACLPAAQAAFETFLTTGEVHNAELVLLRQDGSKLDVSLNVRAKRDPGGNIVMSRSSWRDITKRKQLERQLQQANAQLEARVEERTRALQVANEELKQEIRERKQAEAARLKSEQRLQLALEASGDGLWDWNIAENLVYFDSQFQTMLGYEVGELSGGNSVWERIIHPEDKPWVLETLEAHLQDNDLPYAFDYRVRQKSGDWLWVANYGKVVERDSQGHPLRMTGTHQDISDRKQAELVLREKESFLSSIYEGTEQAIFVLDVEPESTFRFAGLNPALERLTDLVSESVTGLTPDEALPPATAQSVQQHYRNCLDSGKTIVYEESLPFHDQESWWLTTLTPLFNSHSEIYRIIGTSSEITLLKQIEQKLREANQELARSNQELEHFAYIASHDLQEPLRKIKSFSELLASRYQGKLDKKADKYINYVTDGAARMQTMIRDLLTYSRVGRTQITLEPTDLNKIMAQVTSDLGSVIEESHASIHIGPLPTVRAGQTLIRQLLQNLLSNALKYRGDAPPEVWVRAQSTDQTWVIAVQDNGIGIDPQYQDRIFIVFQRLHTRDQYSGTGIGLSVCKKIVELHEGKIWLESELDKGCTFFFSLPKN